MPAGYLLLNDDVARAMGEDGALTHLCRHGFSEGRRLAVLPTTLDTAGDFDECAYWRLNPDVAAVRMRPIEHYCTFGYRERRQIAVNGNGGVVHVGVLVPGEYRLRYPDIAAAMPESGVIGHICAHGYYERRWLSVMPLTNAPS